MFVLAQIKRIKLSDCIQASGIIACKKAASFLYWSLRQAIQHWEILPNREQTISSKCPTMPPALKGLAVHLESVQALFHCLGTNQHEAHQVPKVWMHCPQHALVYNCIFCHFCFEMYLFMELASQKRALNEEKLPQDCVPFCSLSAEHV